MVHYRGRYRRRPMAARSIARGIKRYRRRNKRRTDNFKKGQRTITKVNRYIKRSPKFSIVRGPTSDVTFRRFTNYQQITQTSANWVTNNGHIAYDYIIGDAMSKQDLAYYQTKYAYAQIVGLNFTFVLETTKNLSTVINAGTAMTNYVMTQLSDTSQFPVMYIGHFNSDLMQNSYDIAPTDDNMKRILKYNHIKRLGTRNKVQFMYHMPQSYRSNLSVTSAWTVATKLSDAGQGPTDNEAHGFIWWWPGYSNYISGADVTLTLKYRVDAVFMFRGLLPNTA